MNRATALRKHHHMAGVIVFLLMVGMIAGMAGCEPATRYSLTISSTEGGSVNTPGEGTFDYEEGAVVNLVATPDTGYRFVNWTGDVDTIVDVEAASTTITIHGDYQITANFEEAHELTVSTTQGGSVITPGEGIFTYQAGAVVSLVASPASGHRFVNWTGDVDTIADVEAASTTITINGDYSITANFVAQYVLTIGSTEGGEVIKPGQGTFIYDAGTVVNLVTEADEGYTFMEWTGDVDSVTDVTAASTTVTMESGYTITASFAKGIWDWYDLDAIRDDLSGYYVLANDLDATTAGYAEMASATANEGKGWEPIGTLDPYEHLGATEFTGVLDGQGYEIRGLFIDRPGQDLVGLFRSIARGGVIENLGVVNADVTGGRTVGVLAGNSLGIVSNSYVSASAAGFWRVAGLVGDSLGIVSDSHFSGSVTGSMDVNVMVAGGTGTVSNSHYNYDEVLINGKRSIATGALFADDFEQWLANDKFLDINERLAQQDGYYLIEDVDDFKELLAFGQDSALRFRLQNDLDLGNEANFYIPYFAGEFDGNGHKIRNLSYHFSFLSHVGLFGYLAPGGKVSGMSAENVSITGFSAVGGLVGYSARDSTVTDCYSTGSVTGWSAVGGLVGSNGGSVINCYSNTSVTGVTGGKGPGGNGGLVGGNGGTVANSHYNHDEVLINGKNIITIGALFGEDFEQWLANDKFLDVNERLAQQDGYYLIEDVDDFKELLAFGQDGSLRFRLKNDLDLGDEANFYIPYLAGEFDGNCHKILNLSFGFGFVSHVGLFGYLGSGGTVSNLGVENVNVTGYRGVGGLVGDSDGTVSNSYSTGKVTGGSYAGGLVGRIGRQGTINDSYSIGSVTGDSFVGGLVGWSVGGAIYNSHSACGVTGRNSIGGLVGQNWGSVSNSCSTGSVTGEWGVGGLIGWREQGIVSNSFWDQETSGVQQSAGGIGKTTAEMRSIATFRPWNIVAVAPGETDPAYIWNIVDGQTYPFLSWQHVCQAGGSCSYTISPSSASFSASGGTGSVSVTTQAGCSWTAVSNAAWITITSGSSGTGSGSVSYSVAANTGTSSRTGTMTIAGETFTVTQAGGSCSYTISPRSASASPCASGGPGSVSVTTQAGCSWTAVSNAAWITITSGSSGTGSGSVSYSVANTGTSSRTGTMTIAGNTFTVTRADATLTFTSLTPSTVTTSESCYYAVLEATGCNFYNVDRITWALSGPFNYAVNWNRGDHNWNTRVTVHSDTSMTLFAKVVSNECCTKKTWNWTVTLRDTTGATASQPFTAIYTPP